MRNLKCAQQAFGKQFVGGQPGNVLAVEQHLPGGRRERAGDHIEQRGFTGAVRADQSGD